MFQRVLHEEKRAESGIMEPAISPEHDRRGLSGSGEIIAATARRAHRSVSRGMAKAPVGFLALAAAGGFLAGWLVYPLILRTPIRVKSWTGRRQSLFRAPSGPALTDGARDEKRSLAIAASVALAALASMRARRGRDNPGMAAVQAGGGRYALRPEEIPRRGWKDILVRVYKSIDEDRVMAVAAGMTFFGLLAIFPALAALVSLYGLFADPAEIASTLAGMSDVLPGGVLDVVREQLTRVATTSNGTLGLGVIVGLGISLWSANSGTKALFDGLNIVYDEEEKRSFVKLNLISLAFTLCALIFIVVAIAAVVALPIALRHLPLGQYMEWIIHVARWPILLGIAVVVLALLYRYGPSRDEPQWRWVTWGSVIAGVIWLVASVLFSWYAANFGSYNKTYGSLGAVIGFMTWLWISGIVILLGGEINAEMEHQTLRDSTKGMPMPMGARGATMADTVGAAQGSD